MQKNNAGFGLKHSLQIAQTYCTRKEGGHNDAYCASQCIKVALQLKLFVLLYCITLSTQQRERSAHAITKDVYMEINS